MGSMPPDADRAVEETAARQYGLFSLRQAEDHGVPRSTVYARAKEGRCQPRQPRVFAISGSPDCREARYLAAVLSVDSDDDPVVLSHASAAHHWDLDGCGPAPDIHILSREHHPDDLIGVRPHRSQKLLDHHRTVRRGIPVTTVERTLCDLATMVNHPQLRKAVADAIRRNLVTAESLAATAFEIGRFRGKRKLRRILDELSPLERETANGFESLFLRLMTTAGYAPSAMNHPVVDADGRRRKLDVVWLPGDYPISEPVWRELDGMFTHSEVLDVKDDREREEALIRAGWPEPERITWQDLIRRPERVVRSVVEELRSRRLP